MMMQIGRCPSHSHEIIKQYGNKEMPRKLFFLIINMNICGTRQNSKTKKKLDKLSVCF